MENTCIEVEDHGVELEVGITEFTNTAKAVNGILKQRYSDFIVREISLDGSVSYLSNTSGKEKANDVITTFSR
jgi:tRNA pseudouridine13 synthase